MQSNQNLQIDFNLPKEGILLKSITLKDTDKTKIYTDFLFIEKFFNKFNFKIKTINEDIINYNYSFLKELNELKPLIYNLGNSYFKIDASIEYKQLKHLIDHICPNYIKKIEHTLTPIKDDLYHKIQKMISSFEHLNLDLKQNISMYTNTRILNNLLNDELNQFTIKDFLSIRNNYYNYINYTFSVIRKKLLLNNPKILNFIEDKDSSINIEEIEKVDFFLSSILKEDSFLQFCENFKIFIPNGDTNYQQIIYPNDYLSKYFPIEKDEIIKFKASIESFQSFPVSNEKSIISNKNNTLEYFAISEEEFNSETIYINHSIGNKMIQIVLPVYFSVKKFSLNKNFSSKSLKIK